MKNRFSLASLWRTRRLIVVLGMHRSGTSALTAGLRAVGVTLGENLIEAAPDNPKGYHEDTGIFRLNVKMLQRLGLRWYSLAPITVSAQMALQTPAFTADALKLLRARCANAPVAFGFKDPRTSLFIPFWRQAFLKGRYDARYLLALRNPASVADSLTRRNTFPSARSYLLWLKYSIASVIETNDQRRIVVDYDNVMRDPDGQLKRIAERFALPLNADHLAEYRERFLDSQLRHSERTVDDLATDDVWMPLVREVYATLRAAADDRLDDDGLRNASQKWAAALTRLLAMYASLDQTEALEVPEEEA